MPAWLTLPTLFTLLRFLLAPLVAWLIVTGRPGLALAAFGVAAFTDYLDGATARWMNLKTPAGAALDPLADKLLLSGVFLALGAAHRVPWWLVGIVLGRDVYILAGAVVLMTTTPVRRFPPSIWGKISTCIQIGGVLVWMTKDIVHFGWLDGLAEAGLWIVSAFTIWSGAHYTWRAVQTIRALPRQV